MCRSEKEGQCAFRRVRIVLILLYSGFMPDLTKADIPHIRHVYSRQQLNGFNLVERKQQPSQMREPNMGYFLHHCWPPIIVYLTNRLHRYRNLTSHTLKEVILSMQPLFPAPSSVSTFSLLKYAVSSVNKDMSTE